MSALEGKALKTMMDVIPEDEIVKYKVEGGMKLWLDKLRETCGKPQSEDLQFLFRDFSSIVRQRMARSSQTGSCDLSFGEIRFPHSN